MGCKFCEIIAGKRAASVVLRDEIVTAFMDIMPINTGHVLVVPNMHVSNLAELDEAVGAHMFTVAQRIAYAVRHSGVHVEGVNLMLADGAAAGQTVFHTHLHVVPRYRGDGFGLRFGPRYGGLAKREELEEVAARIKQYL